MKNLITKLIKITLGLLGFESHDILIKEFEFN